MKILNSDSTEPMPLIKPNGNGQIASKNYNDVIAQIKSVPLNIIIGDEITLKKKGNSFTGLCPFHDDSKPSLSVSNEKAIFKCFSCDTSADAIEFIKRIKNIDFEEAIEHIANKHSIIYSRKNPSQEDIEKESFKQTLYSIHQKACDFFVGELNKNLKAKEYASNRVSKEMIERFSIGYAPKGKSLYEHLRKLGFDEDTIIKSQLVKRGDDGNNYDFFRDRLMFPIKDKSGKVIAFSGRAINTSNNTKSPKYINSAASEIYDKSAELYGFFEAKQAIFKAQCIIIVEGYTDCIRLHSIGLENTIALCGTALTEKHIELLKNTTEKVVLLLDADQNNSGQNATKKIAETLIKNEFSVYTYEGIPVGEDPDSFFAANDYAPENETFYLTSLIDNYSNRDLDPAEKEKAFEEIAELLYWHSGFEKESLIPEIAKKFKVKVRSVRDKLEKFSKSIDIKGFSFDNVPAYVKSDELIEKYGFWVAIDDPNHNEKYPPNTYVFKDDVMTNFILKPLHHIIDPLSQAKSFRTFEIINVRNQKALIHLSSEDLSSLANFKKKTENIGNYKLKPGFKLKQLEQLKQFWLDETYTSIRVIRLGWQDDGFWAWANGITTMEKEFIPANEHGIVNFNNQLYFIEASSDINKNHRQQMIAEKRFKYLENEVTIIDVSTQMIKVFGDQAMISIAFYLTSLFSDLLFSFRPELPILNIYGPKSTGKNNHANALLAFFGIPQEALNLKTTTRAALSRHMGEFNNSLFLIDEYKNKIAEEFYLEDLKGIYNRIGRQKMDAESDKKISVMITSMGVLIGQEIPNIDPALLSRVIFLEYKEKEYYTPKEKAEFNKLQELSSLGHSHISAKLIQLRPKIENHYKTKYNKIEERLNNTFSNNDIQIQQRILNSYQTILTCFACVEEYIDIRFSFDQLFEISLKTIKRQSKLGVSVGENSDFWSDLEVLCNSNYDRISDNHDYKIAYNDKCNTYSIAFSFEQIYAKIAAHRAKSREKQLDKVTQKNYLINSREYLESVKSMRIGESNTSRLIFDYIKVREKYEINLHDKNLHKDNIENYQASQPIEETIDSNDIREVDETPF